MVKIVFLGYILWEKTIIYLACFVHCVSMCCHFFVHIITLNYHYPSSLLLSLLWPIVFLSVVNFVTALILPTLNYYQLVISELSFYHCHLSFYVELTFYELSTIILLTLKTILLGCIYVGCSNKLSLSLSTSFLCPFSECSLNSCERYCSKTKEGWLQFLELFGWVSWAREMYGNPCQQRIASLREWAKKEEPRKDDDDDDEDEPEPARSSKQLASWQRKFVKVKGLETKTVLQWQVVRVSWSILLQFDGDHSSYLVQLKLYFNLYWRGPWRRRNWKK